MISVGKNVFLDVTGSRMGLGIWRWVVTHRTVAFEKLGIWRWVVTHPPVEYGRSPPPPEVPRRETEARAQATEVAPGIRG